MRSTIALGVAAGANKPRNNSPIMPGTPCSMAVGISGAAANRCAAFTARMRILPVRWNSSSGPVTFGVIIGMCPLTRSLIPGPAPLYGTWTRSLRPVLLEQFAGEIAHGAATGRAIGELAGMGLGIADELGQCRRRHGRVHHDRRGGDGED